MPTLNDLSASPTAAPPLAPPTGQPPTDPLANLRDIHMPGDISSLPAIGWWIIAAAALTAGIILVAVLIKRRRQNAYRREALTLLQEQSAVASTDPQERLQAINTLLKRVALYAYPNAGAASLHGQQWARFLLFAAPNQTQPKTLAALLENNLYSRSSCSTQDITAVEHYARQWIKRHLPSHKLNDAGAAPQENPYVNA